MTRSHFLPTGLADDPSSKTVGARIAPSDATSHPSSEITHDLRNVLMGIGMLAETLRRSLPDDSPAQNFVESISAGVRHAGNICSELQEALHSANEAPNDVQSLDLSEAIREVMPLLRTAVPGGARLQIDLADDLPTVAANPTQILQIALDLLSNSHDALDGDEGVITIRTRAYDGPAPTADATPLSTQDWVCLEISDTGCGMDEQTQTKIFEPSFSTKASGNGLGLASVRRIVRGYGGEVAVESCLGDGATVRCVFPCSRAQIPDEEKSSPGARKPLIESPLPDEPPAHPMTILMVEDNEAARTSSKLLLESSSRGEFEMLTSGSGKEAVEMFMAHRNRLAAIVLDVNLPDCDGASLLGEFRKHAPGMPVIVASGTPPRQLADHFHGGLPDGILQKPFDEDDLISKLFEVFARSSRTRQTEDSLPA